jgi:hypothetical protein
MRVGWRRQVGRSLSRLHRIDVIHRLDLDQLIVIDLMQARADGFLPQLLPDIRFGYPERCRATSGQIGVQSQEDRRAASWRKAAHCKERTTGTQGRDATRHPGFQQEDLACQLASEGEHNCCESLHGLI